MCFSRLCLSLDVYPYSVTPLCLVLFCLPFLSIGTGYRPKVNMLLFMHIALDTACCLSHYGAAAAAASCLLLLNLQAQKSCTALLLLLLHVCMLHIYGFPFFCRWAAAAACCCCKYMYKYVDFVFTFRTQVLQSRSWKNNYAKNKQFTCTFSRYWFLASTFVVCGIKASSSAFCTTAVPFGSD